MKKQTTEETDAELEKRIDFVNETIGLIPDHLRHAYFLSCFGLKVSEYDHEYK
jgi:hypothetical protein